MTSPEFPKVNGSHASWANLKVKIIGTDVEFSTEDIAAIDFKDSVEFAKVRGQGGHVRGRTEGQYDCEGKISMYLDAAMQFMSALAQVNAKITLVPFNIVCAWEPYVDSDELREVELKHCRIKERNFTASPNTDAHMIEFPIDPLRVFLDGVCLIGDA